MSRKKQKKFNEFSEAPNTIEYIENGAKELLDEKRKHYKKVVLELGCGRGEYTIALADSNSETLYIGVDIQGERLWYGSKEAINKKMLNVIFFRAYIETLLEYFPEKSVDEIWITFPDPYPRKRHSKRRLTSSSFLIMYKKLLKKDGKIMLKTDNSDLFLYSIESVKSFGGIILEENFDIYRNKYSNDDVYFQTYFEKKHLANNCTIKFLSFKFVNIE